MDRIQVESSSIASAGYSPEASTLEIEFRNGRLYQYFAVPKDVFDGLLVAESKGTFLNHYIRGRFAYRKISR